MPSPILKSHAQRPNAPVETEQEIVVNAPALTRMGTLHYSKSPLQRRTASSAAAAPIKPNGGAPGLPTALKYGVQALSGVAMDQVQVHYNSAQPAKINALAFAQGNAIHLGPGQEQHLPHEAWHIAQQAQGRVQANRQLKSGAAINDDVGLEQEADQMGARALALGVAGQVRQLKNPLKNPLKKLSEVRQAVLQCVLAGDEEWGTQIKIWVEETSEVKTVYFVGQNDAGEVYYSAERLKTKTKPSKGFKLKDFEHINGRLAFPRDYANGQVEREIRIEKEAAASLDKSGVSMDQEIIAFVKAQLEKSGAEFEVQLTAGRIQGALLNNDDLKSMMGRDAWTFADFKEIYDGYDDGYLLGEITDAISRTGTRNESSGAGSGSGGGGSDEWKSKKTERLKGELLEELRGSKLFDILMPHSTLHHKMSRSHFKKMLKLLGEAPSEQAGVAGMYKFLAMLAAQGQTGDLEIGLENWVANIELGVLVDKRKAGDDPGEGFDGNYRDGSATPRTQHLQEVDLLVMQAANGSMVDWQEILGLLAQTQTEHENLVGKKNIDKFSLPKLGQWAEDSDGEFTRYRPAMSGSSSKDLGDEKDAEPEVPANITAERGVSRVELVSVADRLRVTNFPVGAGVLVVSGKGWLCYVRCVLHALGEMAQLPAVLEALLELDLDLEAEDGVEVGSRQEQAVMAVITEKTGKAFYVQATDVNHQDAPALSLVQDGQRINLVRTGVHFSLMKA